MIDRLYFYAFRRAAARPSGINIWLWRQAAWAVAFRKAWQRGNKRLAFRYATKFIQNIQPNR